MALDFHSLPALASTLLLLLGTLCSAASFPGRGGLTSPLHDGMHEDSDSAFLPHTRNLHGRSCQGRNTDRGAASRTRSAAVAATDATSPTTPARTDSAGSAASNGLPLWFIAVAPSLYAFRRFQRTNISYTHVNMHACAAVVLFLPIRPAMDETRESAVYMFEHARQRVRTQNPLFLAVLGDGCCLSPLQPPAAEAAAVSEAQPWLKLPHAASLSLLFGVLRPISLGTGVIVDCRFFSFFSLHLHLPLLAFIADTNAPLLSQA